MKKIVVGAIALFSLSAIAVPVRAAAIVYTISGSGSGSIDATAFTDAAFTFTLTGDTANYTGTPGSFQVVDPLASAAFSIAGVGTGTFQIATRLGHGGLRAFFSRSGFPSKGSDLFDFDAPAVDLSSSFGPVAGTSIFALNQFKGVATSLGALTFTASSNVAFSGTLGGAPAVPEPGTWAMMIAGFGLAGFAMRRRRTAGIMATAH